jgi:GntR family transcriptional regulator
MGVASSGDRVRPAGHGRAAGPGGAIVAIIARTGSELLHDSGEDTGVQGSRPRPSHSSHFDRARAALEELAQQRAAAGINRLPSEDQLAAETGFSRPTVRSALLALQKEGKVLRQHGVGTFINRHALGIKANLAEDQSFLSVIEQLGYEAYLDIVGLVEEPLPAHIAEQADLGAGTRGVVIDRLFRASGEPAVLSRDHIPTHHLAVEVSGVSAERSIFAFVRRWTPHEVRYSVATIYATDAEGRVAELLGVAPGTGVLGMEHRHIDQRDEVIGVTQAFVRNDLIRFSVVRSNPDL